MYYGICPIKHTDETVLNLGKKTMYTNLRKRHDCKLISCRLLSCVSKVDINTYAEFSPEPYNL